MMHSLSEDSVRVSFHVRVSFSFSLKFGQNQPRRFDPPTKLAPLGRPKHAVVRYWVRPVFVVLREGENHEGGDGIHLEIDKGSPWLPRHSLRVCISSDSSRPWHCTCSLSLTRRFSVHAQPDLKLHR